MPVNLPDNVTLIGNDTPSETISRNYYTYRNQAVSDAFMTVVTLDNNTRDLVGAECRAFRQNGYTHLIALSREEMERLDQEHETIRETHGTLISKAVMLLGSVPDNLGSSCARSRKRASQKSETRFSERFFPPNRLGEIFPAITHDADSPTPMRFDRDGLEGMPPDPDPQTAHPGQGHQPKQPLQAVSEGHR
jgi:hypothetical protein